MNYASTTLNVPSTTENIVVSAGIESFKGNTTITFVLTGINESIYEVLFLNIDWGDGSPKEYYQKDLFFDYKEQSIIDSILLGKAPGSIATYYTHTYFNQLSTYNQRFYAKFMITYSNGKYVYFIQPIDVYHNSFYDEIGELNILNSQILSNTSNLTFVNFGSKISKQTYVGILSGN